MAPPARGTVLPGVCPQCHTPLEVARADDGRLYQHCNRCGWNNLDAGGIVTVGGAAPAVGPGAEEMTPSAAAQAKSRSCVLVVAGLSFLLTAGAALLVLLLSHK